MLVGQDNGQKNAGARAVFGQFWDSFLSHEPGASAVWDCLRKIPGKARLNSPWLPFNNFWKKRGNISETTRNHGISRQIPYRKLRQY